jgi:hypothetical protein
MIWWQVNGKNYFPHHADWSCTFQEVNAVPTQQEILNLGDGPVNQSDFAQWTQ